MVDSVLSRLKKSKSAGKPGDDQNYQQALSTIRNRAVDEARSELDSVRKNAAADAMRQAKSEVRAEIDASKTAAKLAEIEKNSAVRRAESEKKSAIRQAETDKKSAIRQAESEKNSAVKRAETEMNTAIRMKEGSDQVIANQKVEIERLRTKVAGYGGQKSTISDLNKRIETEKGRAQKLEVKVAELTGKLSAAKVVKPAPVSKPQPIPEFEFNPIRDATGRIVSVKAKPVLN